MSLSDAFLFYRRSAQSMDDARYCNLHIVVDGYFTHYLAGGNRLEAAKLITQHVTHVHEVR